MEQAQTTVYFVRHGEAEGNILRVYHGSTDSRLTPNGLAQLELLAERFRNIRLDAVYASPLTRALQTAQALNRYPKAPLLTEDGLREWDGGCWEGVAWEELPKLYPDEWTRWQEQPQTLTMPGGESLAFFAGRCIGAAERIVEMNRGKTIALVSHGGVMRVLMWHFHGQPMETLARSPWHDNTSVSCMCVDAQGVRRVVFENDISHLREGMSTFSKQRWWRTEDEKQKGTESI